MFAADDGTTSADWPHYGGTQRFWRYSSLAQINAKNVSKLGVAWAFQTGDYEGGFQATPIVVDGVMYVSTSRNHIYALDAATGKEIWKYTYQLPKGFTVFYWATGTWWIPMLLVLALWRHVCRRFPLNYDPLYWGAVFPLGMYAAGTDRMIEAMAIGFLDFVPPVFFPIALVAWVAAFAGLALDLLRRMRRAAER